MPIWNPVSEYKARTGRSWRSFSKGNRRGIQDRQNMVKFEQRESKMVQDRQKMERFGQREPKRGTREAKHGEV